MASVGVLEQKNVLKHIGGKRENDVSGQVTIKKPSNRNTAELTLTHPSGDCSITLPARALKDGKEIKLELEQNLPHLPQDHVPITQVIKLKPCMTLQKNATITIRTWGHNKNGGKAHLYFQKMTNPKNHSWECIDTLQLGEQEFFKFEVSNLCKYCLAVDEADDGIEFVVESCLFYHTNGRLINRIIPRCLTMKRRIASEMAEREYKSVCSDDVRLMISMGDVLSIELTPCDRELWNSDGPRQEFRITDDLLRGIGDTTLDFLLPSNCIGTVDFNHKVAHLREAYLLKVMEHADRIVVGKDAWGPTAAVAEYLTAGATTSLRGKYRGGFFR